MVPVPQSPAGYSGAPLPRKLGIKPGSRLLLVDPPAGLDIEPLPPEVIVDVAGRTERADDGTHDQAYDMVLFFTASRRDLGARFEVLTEGLTPAGNLWVCWPKPASGVTTDMTENAVRDHALPRGWVDTKVCAVDATWSGLRLVLRVENRPGRGWAKP